MNYTSHQKGSLRDSLIVKAIETNKVLTTDQIELLFFAGLKNSKRIAQRRLKVLADDKKLIKRNRLSIDQPYYYYTKKVEQLDHALAVSWIYVWFALRLASWEQIISFWRENDYSVLRADVFAGLKNIVTGCYSFYFVEIDLGENAMDKVQKYNALYQSEKYLSVWWTEYAKRFPSIIIVTNREKLVMRKIEEDNIYGLEFKVMSLEEIKKECFKWFSCSS